MQFSKKVNSLIIFFGLFIFLITIFLVTLLMWDIECNISNDKLLKIGIATNEQDFLATYPIKKSENKNVNLFNQIITLTKRRNYHFMFINTKNELHNIAEKILLDGANKKNKLFLEEINKFCHHVEKLPTTGPYVFIENMKSIDNHHALSENIEIAFENALLNNNANDAFKYLFIMKKINDYGKNNYMNNFGYFSRLSYKRALQLYLSKFPISQQQLQKLTNNNWKPTTTEIMKKFKINSSMSLINFYKFSKTNLNKVSNNALEKIFPKTFNILGKHKYVYYLLRKYFFLRIPKFRAELANVFMKTNNLLEKKLTTNTFDIKTFSMSKNLNDFEKQFFKNSRMTILDIVFAATQQRCLDIAIAIEKYKLKYQHKPQQLTELVPEFLTAEQIKTFRGNEFKYQTENIDFSTLYPTATNPEIDQQIIIEIKDYLTKKLAKKLKTSDKKILKQAVEKEFDNILNNASTDAEIRKIAHSHKIKNYKKITKSGSGYRIYSNDITIWNRKIDFKVQDK
ncbi:hypothetical protein AAEX28_09025 [Lentisphaerota bacterium WC36G]|nr:hypothetical protein LJT99_11875 [Lentisphaerae bacterium WC36]